MRVVVMGLAASLILLGWFVQRFFGGRRLSLSHWFILCAFGGLIFAATFTLLTLLFMAVKTGLHAHGPEFSVAEISWLLNRWVVWAIAAALGGLGLGALAAFMAKATP